VETQENGDVRITWENDLPGYGADHVSTFPAEFFAIHQDQTSLNKDRYMTDDPKLWDRDSITKNLQFVDYEDYMAADETLYRALRQLRQYGLLIVRGVPESETSVISIGERMGNLRDTFYGRTWDVKSVPQAKNVAYTAQYLGLHMDLLYMTNPPGLQLLHCLKNSCEGGSSLFSDSFAAASKLPKSQFNLLRRSHIAYHYRNAGEHYYYRHPVIEYSQGKMDQINYSPPFQADHIHTGDHQVTKFHPFYLALKAFAVNVEAPEHLYEYRLQEGECVVFNNRRVLHGRRQFDTSLGERWLKGAYVDTDVFLSRLRVMSEKFQELDGDAFDAAGQFVKPGVQDGGWGT